MKSKCCGADNNQCCVDCGSPVFELLCSKCWQPAKQSDHLPEAAKMVADHIVDATKKIERPTEEEIEKEVERLGAKWGLSGFGGFDTTAWTENAARDMCEWLRERMGVK